MNFEYPLYQIHDKLFEDLVILICQQLLGIGSIRFANSNDGGRDGRFEGVAEKHPSSKKPWSGKFIIQSKHTTNPVALCSDSDFRRDTDLEIIKMKKLRDSGEIDNYLIFTNRSLTGEEESNRIKIIKDGIGIENCSLFGKENINLWLNGYPNIPEQLGLNKFVVPLIFHESDIKKIIHYFCDHLEKIVEISQEAEGTFKRIDLTNKNEKNKLSKEYFEFLKKNSLSYFHQIDKFLKDSINRKALEQYLSTTMELGSKIISSRRQFGSFDEIFDQIYNYILKNSKENELNSNERRLIYVFLHYMYYNCDIGVS